MHSSPYMTHRQELLSVLIFVRVTKDEISGAHTTVGVLEFHGQLFGGSVEVLGLVRSSHADIMIVMEKADRAHGREELG